MEYVRLNENVVRITLTNDEIEAYGFDWKDLMSEQEDMVTLVREIIKYVDFIDDENDIKDISLNIVLGKGVVIFCHVYDEETGLADLSDEDMSSSRHQADETNAEKFMKFMQKYRDEEMRAFETDDDFDEDGLELGAGDFDLIGWTKDAFQKGAMSPSVNIRPATANDLPVIDDEAFKAIQDFLVTGSQTKSDLHFRRVIFSFENFNDAVALSKDLRFFDGLSSLYKYKDMYYISFLFCTNDVNEYPIIYNIARVHEFGNLETTITMDILQDDGELIMKDVAIELLRYYFK